MAFGEWQSYVPVSERRAKAAAATGKMRAQGIDVQPVRIEGPMIAKTFWGKAWCKNLESYSDFENRLPRGRTYVRNGSVCHLEIHSGEIRARVIGSEMYEVAIQITPLAPPSWARIKKQCTGGIASLLDLLGGHISDGVMEVVTDREHGMFPHPREISLSCSCPDRAVMCKHVAAVLYGVGARLDEKPDLLFVLRGVDHEELIEEKAEGAVETALARSTRRRLAESDLSEVFGVEMDLPVSRQPRGKKTLTGRTKKQRAASLPARLTAKLVRDLRSRSGLTVAGFARHLGVSATIVGKWESALGVLRVQSRTRAALEREWKRVGATS